MPSDGRTLDCCDGRSGMPGEGRTLDCCDGRSGMPGEGRTLDCCEGRLVTDALVERAKVGQTRQLGEFTRQPEWVNQVRFKGLHMCASECWGKDRSGRGGP